MAYFELDQRGTTVAVELRAGLVSFLSCSYVLLLIPHLLMTRLPESLPADAVQRLTQRLASGVALSSAIATLFSGLLTNHPLILLPGLGVSAAFTSALPLSSSLSVSASSSLSHPLSCAAVSGLLLALLSFLSVDRLARVLIPDSLKLAVMAGLGLSVALAGLQMAAIVRVRPDGQTLELAELGASQALAACGVLGVAVLLQHRVQASMLIGVLVVAVASQAMQWSMPELPSLHSPQLHIQSPSIAALLPLSSSLSVIVSVLLVLMFDITALVHSVSLLLPLEYRRERFVYLVAGVATVIGSALSSPPLIVAVESVVGVKEGGKTGLTAVTVSALFLLSLLLSPLLSLVPPAATAPLLVLVGAFLFADATRLPIDNVLSGIPAFLTLALVPFTSSIACAVLSGLTAHVVLAIASCDCPELWPLRCFREEQEEGVASDEDEHRRLLESAMAKPNPLFPIDDAQAERGGYSAIAVLPTEERQHRQQQQPQFVL